MVKSWTKELFQKLKKGAKLTCQKCIFSTYKSGRREAGNKWIVDIKLCIDVHRKIYIFKKLWKNLHFWEEMKAKSEDVVQKRTQQYFLFG